MNPNSEEALFAMALEKPAEKRAAFLDAMCDGNAALRQRLDALLAAHEQPDDPLDAVKATIKLDFADEPPDEAVGQKIGRYKILERVGEGGCGVVYVAEQTEPVRRRVALKVIKLGMDTKQVVARFEAERQALAMMDHPNIAKVLDAGATDTGRPYFIMELVRGIRITDYCDQAQLSTKDRLDLFIQVCHAIQHAHQKGIIHRDIKPSNILVTLNDGVAVPKVIDFGIAKATEGRLTDATVYTQLHQFIGTPAYMSPEQAEMTSLDIDTRSDIYSLGVLLYELLAGCTPFDGKELMSLGIDAMRKTIREKEPLRPSTRLATLQGELLSTTAKRHAVEVPKLMRQLKGDLDWIVMKCLEKDRQRRYETANGLAADIQRHLNTEPVVARPPSKLYEFQKTVRRHKVGFAATAAIIVVLAVGVVVSAWQAVRAKRAEDAAEAEAQRAVEAELQSKAEAERATKAENSAEKEKEGAVAARAEMRQTLYASEMSAIQGRIQSPFERSRAISTLQGWNPKPGNEEDDLRGWEWYFAMSQAIPDTETRIVNAYTQPRWSPDGKWISTLRYVTGNTDLRTTKYCMQVLDAESGVVLKESDPIPFVDRSTDQGSDWSPDGSVLARSLNNEVYVWNLNDTRAPQILGVAGRTGVVAWSPDSKILAIEVAGRSVQLWANKEESSMPRVMTLPEGSAGGTIGALQWSNDGQHVFAATTGGTVHEFAIATGNRREVRKLGEQCVRLCWSRDGRFLAGVSQSTHVAFVWDMTDPVGKPRVIDCSDYFRPYINNHKVIDFSPDNRYLALASWSHNVTVWEVETGLLVSVNANTLPVAMTQWSPDGKRLLSAVFRSGSGSKHWNPFPPRTEGFEGVRRCAWSPDGIRLVTIGSNGVTVWDSVDMEMTSILKGMSDGDALDVAVHPDNRRIATLCRNGEVILNDLQTGEMIEKVDFAARVQTGDPITGAIPDNSRIQWSPDGRVLGVAKGSLLLWDMLEAKVVFANHAKGWWDGYINLVFHPELDLVAGAAFGGIEVWNYRSGEQILELNNNSGDFAVSNYTPLDWSPDGRALAAAHDRGALIIPFDGGKWNATARYRKFTHFGGGEITGLHWGKDSMRVYTTFENHTLNIWLADSGQEVQVIDDVDAAKMDPLGLRIAALGAGGLRILDASPAYKKEHSPKALPLLNARLARNPDSIPDLVTRGKIAIRSGRLAEAARDHQRVEGLFANQIAANPANRVAALRRIEFSRTTAAMYREAGHGDEALKRMEEALAFSRRALGAEHRETLWAMINLAGYYRRAGRNAEAVELGKSCLAGYLKARGDEDSETLNAMTELAISYQTAGRIQEAIALEEKALALKRKLLGNGHSWTKESLENLTTSYEKAGRSEDVKKLRDEFANPAIAKAGSPQPAPAAMPPTETLSRAGKFAEAAQASRANLERGGPELAGVDGKGESIERMILAATLLAAGDHEGYRAVCAETVNRFRNTGAANHAERTAKICLLSPDSGVDAATLGAFLKTGQTVPSPWKELVNALAEYRLGHWESAADWAKQARAVPGFENTSAGAAAAGILAMAEYQQQHPEEAATALTAAQADIAKQWPTGVDRSWHDWLIADLLAKEAGTLMNKATANSQP